MSAFMCSDNHIAYLVHAIRHHARRHSVCILSHELAEIARLMKWENARSVAHRYPKTDKPCPSCGLEICDPARGYDSQRPATWTLPIPQPQGWRPGVPAPCPFAVVAMKSADSYQITPVGTIKLAQSYMHQANEHPGWENSETHRRIEALISDAIGTLDGYDAAPWAIS